MHGILCHAVLGQVRVLKTSVALRSSQTSLSSAALNVVEELLVREDAEGELAVKPDPVFVCHLCQGDGDVVTHMEGEMSVIIVPLFVTHFIFFHLCVCNAALQQPWLSTAGVSGNAG